MCPLPPELPLTQPLATAIPFFGSMNLAVLDILYNWNHAIFVYQCLIYFT